MTTKRLHILSQVVLCLALPLGSFGQAAPHASSGNPIATVAGQPIYEQDVIQSLGPQLLQLRNQEYQLKSKALDDLIRQKLIEAEANKRGISAQELLEQEADSKVAEPTDGEVEAYFLGQNRVNARFDEVKEQFRATLKRARLQKERPAALASKGSSGSFTTRCSRISPNWTKPAWSPRRGPWV